MKYVESGSGKIPLITLLAILSISLTINLPGLAVSPMLGKLRHVFNSTELESQMLTSLPNLIMIPVVLLAGKLSTPRRQTAILCTGLSIFFVAGLASIFADSMWLLIVLGCAVGVGCGLVVPIAAGIISEWISGPERQSDLGLKSTASNSMVIVANLFVGSIVIVNWHAAFAVYLIPIIPLCLMPFMTRRYILAHRVEKAPAEVKSSSVPAIYAHIDHSKSTSMLIMLIVLYMILTYATTSISYYAPFVMEKYGMGTTEVGIVTAAYYFMVAVTGAFVDKLKRIIGKSSIIICLGLVACSLIVMGYTHSYVVMLIFSLLTGFGYGIIQPIIYDKTTYVAPTPKLGMTYFGYVLSANYMAIMMVPFVDSFFRKLFNAGSPGFEFVFSGVVAAALLVWSIIERRNYIFTTVTH